MCVFGGAGVGKYIITLLLLSIINLFLCDELSPNLPAVLFFWSFQNKIP